MSAILDDAVTKPLIYPGGSRHDVRRPLLMMTGKHVHTFHRRAGTCIYCKSYCATSVGNVPTHMLCRAVRLQELGLL